VKINDEPLRDLHYADIDLPAGKEYAYAVRAINRRGIESEPTRTVKAVALPQPTGPTFIATFGRDTNGKLSDDAVVEARVYGKAKVSDGALDLRRGGYVTYPHQQEFDLRPRLSVECWVCFEEAGHMPVILSCGHWRSTGWFLQRIGRGWRWHVGGVSCDGGKLALKRWIHLVATFDGKRAAVYENGVRVATKECEPDLTPWSGPLFVGQYVKPGSPHQVNGSIAGVKFYRRVLKKEDALSAFKAGRP